MRCENKFCIYNFKNACVCGETEIDYNGTCKKCEYININDEELEKIKAESFKEQRSTTNTKKYITTKFYFD
ncbi:MAG: hypothetical protein E7522_02955 [Ruminococcaceae bacterium]|nr:hypothetical protein [Oscillospiraceae bacterium]